MAGLNLSTKFLESIGYLGSGRSEVINVTGNLVVTSNHYGKTLRMNSASDYTFTLPSVDLSSDGAHVTFMKEGAGKVTIQAADSDLIADSSAGGTIYDDVAAELYATITLEYVHAIVTWVVVGAHGTWVTA